MKTKLFCCLIAVLTIFQCLAAPATMGYTRRYFIRLMETGPGKFQTEQQITGTPYHADTTVNLMDAGPQPAKGYYFVGWKYNNTMLPDPIFTVSPPQSGLYLNIYGIFSKDGLTVTFDTQDGSPVDTITTSFYQTIPDAPIPTRNGHVFGGWYTDAACSGEAVVFPYTVKRNTTLYAKWTPVYTVRFLSSDGTQIDAQTVEHGACVAPPDAPAMEGHTFAGWWNGAELLTEEQVSSRPVTAPTDYTARYDVNRYPVSFFDANGAQIDAQTVTHGACVAPPDAPAMEGHTFTGWWDGTELLTEEQVSSRPVTTPTTYTARYDINRYPVSFYDANGAQIDAQTVEHGACVAPPDAPAVEGHTFAGWWGGTELLTEEQVLSRPVTAPTDYTARYDINRYPVSFYDANGAQIDAQTVAHGACAAPPDAPAMEGHTFTGWWDGTELLTKEQVLSRPVTAPTDYTARYDINRYPVSFYDADDIQIDSQTVTHGACAAPPDAPAMEGHTFTGWWNGAELLTKEQVSLRPVTAPMTYTARYEPSASSNNGVAETDTKNGTLSPVPNADIHTDAPNSSSPTDLNTDTDANSSPDASTDAHAPSSPDTHQSDNTSPSSGTNTRADTLFSSNVTEKTDPGSPTFEQSRTDNTTISKQQRGGDKTASLHDETAPASAVETGRSNFWFWAAVIAASCTAVFFAALTLKSNKRKKAPSRAGQQRLK